MNAFHLLILNVKKLWFRVAKTKKIATAKYGVKIKLFATILPSAVLQTYVTRPAGRPGLAIVKY